MPDKWVKTSWTCKPAHIGTQMAPAQIRPLCWSALGHFSSSYRRAIAAPRGETLMCCGAFDTSNLLIITCSYLHTAPHPWQRMWVGVVSGPGPPSQWSLLGSWSHVSPGIGWSLVHPSFVSESLRRCEPHQSKFNKKKNNILLVYVYFFHHLLLVPNINQRVVVHTWGRFCSGASWQKLKSPPALASIHRLAPCSRACASCCAFSLQREIRSVFFSPLKFSHNHSTLEMCF